MDKKAKRILLAFGVALLAIIIIEIVRPKPLDWRESYTSEDTIPFGCYIIYEELEGFFNDSPVKIIQKNPFEFLRDSTYSDGSLYFFVNSDIHLDKRSFERISNYVSAGNTVFISAREFGTIFRDSLKLETNASYYLQEEEIRPTFFNSSLQSDSLSKYKKGVYKAVITEFDTINTTVLGHYINEEELDPLTAVNFIKVAYGEGAFYFHTLPEAFSNYYLMEGNQEYIAQTLSYLEPSEIYWDNYLKSGRKIVDSPMRFILTQVSLKWGYYILMIGLVLFVIFKGKRVQRIIKIISPLENSSIEFTKTIGDLHFQHKDFGNILAKKITYFLEKVRTQYYLDTNKLDSDFCKKLALKSNTNLEQTKELIDTIKSIKGKTLHNEQDLIHLNKLMEEFTL